MSIASEITSIGENLKKDYQAIANLGADLTNVDKNIENIAELLDGVYDNLPKTEYQEGSSITLENTLKGKLDFDDGKVGFGQTSQESTQGYNLIPMNYGTTTTRNGMTCKITEDGRIILNGTTSELTTFFVFGNGDATQKRITLPAGAYTGTIGKNITENVRVMTNIMKTNNTQLFSGQLRYSNYENVTVNEETYIGNVNVTILGSTTLNNYELDVMVISGTYTSSNMPNFEKYTGGYSSPSPNWEQEIKCVAGRNKLDVSTNINGYVLSPTGELNQVEGYCVSDFMPVQPGATYNVSYKLLSSVQDASTTRVGFYDSSKTFISRPDSTDNPYIITIPSNCHYVRLSYQYPARSEMQFEEGSAIHSYLPYGVIQETIRSKNIFDFAKLKNGNPGMNYPDRASITFGNDTFTIDVTTQGDNFTNTGMVVTNNTVPSEQRKFLYEVKPNTTYTFVYKTEHSTSVGLSAYYSLINSEYKGLSFKSMSTNNYIQIDSTHRRFYKTFTTTSDAKYVAFRYGNQGSVPVTYSELMLVEGEYTSSNLPTYEPYITPTSYQLSLGDIELNAIGNYKDELIYDVENDKVYKNEKINKKSITDIIGSRTVTYNSTYSQFTIAQNPLPDLANNSNYADQYYTPTFLCNSYKASTFINALTSTGYFVSYLYVDAENNRQLRFKNADITDVNTFISSIANDYLVYPLEQATLIEITDTTLINQVKALYNAHSLNGTTIIESNGDLPMIIKVRGLKGAA